MGLSSSSDSVLFFGMGLELETAPNNVTLPNFFGVGVLANFKRFTFCLMGVEYGVLVVKTLLLVCGLNWRNFLSTWRKHAPHK